MPTDAERKAAGIEGARILKKFHEDLDAMAGARCRDDWSRQLDADGQAWHISPSGLKKHLEGEAKQFTDPVTLRPWWLVLDGSWHFGPWVPTQRGKPMAKLLGVPTQGVA